jgi:hypothetical protein
LFSRCHWLKDWGEIRLHQDLAFPILNLQDNILFSLCLFLEKTINFKPVFKGSYDSKWSHPDWTSKYQTMLSLFTGIMADILFCQVHLFTLGFLGIQAFQKAKKSIFKAIMCRQSNLAFSFKNCIKSLHQCQQPISKLDTKEKHNLM